MWIVKLGLRRPYTLAVVAILLFVLGGIGIQRTPTDILREYSVRLNTSPAKIPALNDVPVAQRGAQVIYIRDLAQALSAEIAALASYAKARAAVARVSGQLLDTHGISARTVLGDGAPTSHRPVAQGIGRTGAHP